MIEKNLSIRWIRPISVINLIIILLPFVGLLTRTSTAATILSRYTTGYFSFLLLYLCLVIVFGLICFIPFKSWVSIQNWISSRIQKNLFNLIGWLATILSIIILVICINILNRWALSENILLQIALFSMAIYISCIIWLLIGSTKILQALGYLTLVGFSIGLGLVFVELFMRWQPRFIPAPILLSMPGGGRYLHVSDFLMDKPMTVGYRFAPLQKGWKQFNPYDTTLSADQVPIGPYGTGNNPPLRLFFQTDENGFINPPPVQGINFDVVMTGDSFLTWSAEKNWVEEFGSLTNKHVLNLGMPGWGTQAEVEAIRQYGLDKKPKLVILAYFEGNDLWDIERYNEKKSSGYDWIESDTKSTSFWDLLLVPRLVEYVAQKIVNGIKPSKYVYPIDLNSENKTIQLAFSQQHIGTLSASLSDLENSHNVKLFTNSIKEAQRLAQSNGARFLLIYIPTEERVYLPLISDPDDFDNITFHAYSVALNDQGNLYRTSTPVDYERLMLNMDDQVSLINKIAAQNGIEFLDLTPYFREEASRGVELYNYTDTHWNSTGHELAAKILADYLVAHP